MKPETDVISVPGNYKVHIEYHRIDKPRAKTIIMVNGALATTASFSQSVRDLKENAHVLLFDLPFAGQSRKHNAAERILTKEDEVDILLYLIDFFQVSYLMSASWGGVSSLLSLARRPATLEKALIASFSPVLNSAMRDYMLRAKHYLHERDIPGGANLLNSTVGKHLPNLLKLHNYQYLLSMVDGNEEQIMFHIDQLFDLDHCHYVNRFADIEVPVIFVNGSLDEYTTPHDVRAFSQYIKDSRFAVIEEAGHFLDMESKQAWRSLREIKREFFFGNGSVTESMPSVEPGTLGVALAV